MKSPNPVGQTCRFASISKSASEATLMTSGLRLFIATWLCLVCFTGFSADTNALAKLQNIRRIVFLGDSITYAGGYVADVEAYYVTRFPDRHFDFINVGLSSETVSGLSEASEKNPRPDLHTRLASILEKTKPDLTFVCYGMNDGIYHPPDAARLKAFQDGMKSVHQQIAATGAKIIHVTPPVFDPIAAKARISTNDSFGFSHPYRDYNQTLDQFSEWLVAQRAAGWEVADLHSGMNRWLAEERERDPDFSFSKDGVHPDALGHWIMAKQILLYLGANDVEDVDDVSEMLAANPHGANVFPLVHQKEELLRDAWLNYCGFNHPGVKKGLPVSEAEAKAAELDEQIREFARLSPAASKIKSTTDIDRLLKRGMGTNQIVAELGWPDFQGSFEEEKNWWYGLSPFPGEGDMKALYMSDLILSITNGHLMQWNCSYRGRNSYSLAGAQNHVLSGRKDRKPGGSMNLKLFLVSDHPMAAGQFVDSDLFPKLGWISKKPDLEIPTLKSVVWRINLKAWQVDVSLDEDDAAKFGHLTEANVAKKLLIVVGDKLVSAPVIRSRLSDGFAIEGTGQSELEVLKNNLANLIAQEN